MKWHVYVALCVFALSIVPAVPAQASTSPTAEALVRKLVKAKACTNLQIVNATETAVQCTDAKDYVGPQDIVIHAYKNRGASLRSLDQQRVEDCQTFGIDTIRYIVGPTWWSEPYDAGTAGALTGPRIIKTLKGKLKTYGCK
jgi:hypothetical protein